MEKPFQINSVTVPLMGWPYLEDRLTFASGGEDNDPGLVNFIDRIVASGADSAKLIVHTVMDRATDNGFDTDMIAELNPSDDAIAKFAEKLQARGLQVEINPIVVIANKEDSTNIIADRINPTDVHLWMENYSNQMLKWASLAERIGAKRLTLFTDLEQHMSWKPELTDSWVQLATDIRKVFSGHLSSTLWTDATDHSWGNVFDLTPDAIWQSLDSLGVSPFPEPLTNLLNPTVEQLIAGWYENAVGARPVDFFKNLSERFDKPVYFNDRTFRSLDGTNINEGQIWQSTTPVTPDLQEQADLFESFLRVFSLEQGDWLLGVSFNSITRLVDPFPIDDPMRYMKGLVGEDWEGKPAGDVLAAWYGGQRQSQGRLFVGDADVDKNDRIVGGYHHDSLEGGLGDDYLDGGAGIDTAIYSGVITDYSIRAGANATVRDSQQQRDGADTLLRVERAQFADGHLALDIDGVAGQAYRIYKAAFDRAPDLPGLGYWIAAMDGGAEITGVAGGFIASAEFQSRYGNVNDTDFIRLLYENVLDRQPDAGGYAFWQDAMGRGLTREGLLAEFSESKENKANVEGLIVGGIEYTPFIS